MCHRGLTGQPTVTLTKSLKYGKILLLRCIHYLQTDLINNMDHMCISGTEPSSVFLSQTKICDDSIIRVPISLVRTKSVGNDFCIRSNGRISNPENSLIQKYRPGTNVSVLTNHHWNFSSWNLMPKRTKTNWSQKGWCNTPTKLQFQSILTRKILIF